MKTFLLKPACLKFYFVVAIFTLSMSAFAQTVNIVPNGSTAKPNLIPVNNSVTFSIDPIGFGSCMNNLSYSWAILNSKKDTVYKSTASTPNYNFTIEDTYTVYLTVKTVPGGYCSSSIIKYATSIIKVAKLGGTGGAPQPNMFAANNLGTMISAYTMDNTGQITSGPYDYFDPFPSTNAITAALSMDDKGNFFYLPTFMNGPDPMTASQVKQYGAVQVWAVDKKANNAPVVIASFDMNGASTTELGLFRMGLDSKGNAWILAGDGNKMYAATFKTNGTKPVKSTDISIFPVPFESGSASDFESGDLAFDNKGNMYVLAGSSSGTYIYTMSTNSTDAVLSRKWKVTDAAGKNFSTAVTGTVFDAQGNMYFSALDGIYYINNSAVSAATATATVTKVSDNFGLMDLATSQFPAAWTPPVVGPATILPVKLISFTGTAKADNILMNWDVAANETGNHFELEKSYNGTSFTTASLIFNTEKQGEEAYNFTDKAPATGKVYYRLKMINKDQSISYSSILSFDGKAKQLAKLTLLQNPVNNALNFTYTATENSQAEIAVYTYTGVKVFAQKHTLQKGGNSINIPLTNMLGKGIYLLEVKEGANSQTVKFVKQ